MMMIKKEKEFKNFVHKTISQLNQSFSEVVICDFMYQAMMLRDFK